MMSTSTAGGSKIPVPVVSGHRGLGSSGVGSPCLSGRISPPIINTQSPGHHSYNRNNDHNIHHPHLQNHMIKSPIHRQQVMSSSSVASHHSSGSSSSPFESPSHHLKSSTSSSSSHHSTHHSNQQTPPPSGSKLCSTSGTNINQPNPVLQNHHNKSPPKFEAYVMTGDLMINLASRQSSDSILQNQFREDPQRIPLRRRRQITAPNIHSSSIRIGMEPEPEYMIRRPATSYSSQSTQDHQNESSTHHPSSNSLPNSPPEHNKHPSHHRHQDSTENNMTSKYPDVVQNRSQTQDSNQTRNNYNSNSSSVRLSRSEDHLRDSLNMVRSVEFDDQNDDRQEHLDQINNQKNSMEILLNPRPELLSSSETSEHLLHPCMSRSTSSSNGSSAASDGVRDSSCSPSGSDPNDSSAATGSRGYPHRRSGSPDDGSLGVGASSPCSSETTAGSAVDSSSFGSYTANTATLNPTNFNHSTNGSSPAKTNSMFAAADPQTESSLSEGYSLLNSLAAGVNNNVHNNHRPSSGQGDVTQHHQQNPNHNNRNNGTFERKKKSSSPSDDHNPQAPVATNASLSISSTGESCVSPDNSSPLDTYSEIEVSHPHEKCKNGGCDEDPDENQDSPSKKSPPAPLNTTSSPSVPPVVNTTDHGPKRYPSFITPEVDAGDDQMMCGDEADSSHHLMLDDEYNPCPAAPKVTVDVASASRLAKRLYELQGFKKSDVSRHLSKNNEFSRVVAEEYLKFFDFKGDTLDCALRKFLTKFSLVGETQERERVLVHFSKRYLDCNPDSFKSSDSIHTLTCALMLLNTDLHGENVGRKMTCGEFIENLSDLHEGDNFPVDVLRSLYTSIKNQALQWAHDGDDSKMNGNRSGSSGGNLMSLFAGGADSSRPESRNGDQVNPFLEFPNNSATEFKRGYIVRKCCFDPNGKKTPMGKRGWKMFYATLRDLVLYLHKDEQGFRKNQLYESLNNSIRVHHALASKASDYTKKDFVLRLQTADQAEYLFKTSDARELQSWIDAINFAAASLSSPPLAPAVGSHPLTSRKFQRPLLPVSHTKFNLREQLLDHDYRILKMEQELESHVNKPPESRTASRRILAEYAEKEIFFQNELKRYETYSTILKMKLQQTLGAQALDKVLSKSLLPTATGTSAISLKPLTSLSIGEEVVDDDYDPDDPDGNDHLGIEAQEPVIQPVVKRKTRNTNR